MEIIIIDKFIRQAKKLVSKIDQLRAINPKTKIFCIGLNKTGTTSLEKALKDLGYKMGDQNKAHALLYEYEKRNFKSIVNFCKTADAFQDAPFSYYYTYMFLDHYFPDSKFILSERSNSEEWYHSLVRFHTKKWSKTSEIPTADDLRNAKRFGDRNVLDNFISRFNVTENDPFNKHLLINYYETHNAQAKDYFKFKNNLLVLNIAESSAYLEMCKFIEKKPIYKTFPWENKTTI